LKKTTTELFSSKFPGYSSAGKRYPYGLQYDLPEYCQSMNVPFSTQERANKSGTKKSIQSYILLALAGSGICTRPKMKNISKNLK
jgi:hypothetical protein